MNKLKITKEILEKIIKDKKVRTAITKESHQWFFPVYLNRYMKYETADFQTEMLNITERKDIQFAVIVAFRGSAKSTIMTLSYPIWSILGEQQKKFVLILSQTQQQAKLHFTNLKKVLETEDLLRRDLGPFKEEVDEWGSFTIVLPKYNARITAASSEQSIRGMRHGQHRPDLIICDDVEDLQSAKTREGRNKTYSWFTSEVVPAGDKDTKIIVIGNLLHEDSLLMRLKEDIEEKRLDGIFRMYPIVDEEKILWLGKYKNLEDIKQEKKRIGDRIAWEREFMLNIVPEVDQVIHREWIKYYDVLPKKELRSIRIGVDLAISNKDTADFTAMVIGKIYGEGKDTKIFIQPNPINKKMDFPETVELCKSLHQDLKREMQPDFTIEDIGYQRSLPQQLEQEGLSVRGVKIGAQDKRSRLARTTHWIETGHILFPTKGAETLIEQLVGFGKEKHDDLADAFAYLILDVIQNPMYSPSITFIDIDTRIDCRSLSD